MNAQTIKVPTGSPPPWFNAAMRRMLRTPGLERWLGRGIAILTVTGSTTGRKYQIPVSYHRVGSTVIVLTKTFRRWWRNLKDRPEVDLRLAGRRFSGKASASIGDERALPTLVEFLENRPLDARAYGIELGGERRVPREQARALLGQIVVIRVELVPEN